MLETSASLTRYCMYLGNLTLINLFGTNVLYTGEKLLSLVKILKLSQVKKSNISIVLWFMVVDSQSVFLRETQMVTLSN